MYTLSVPSTFWVSICGRCACAPAVPASAVASTATQMDVSKARDMVALDMVALLDAFIRHCPDEVWNSDDSHWRGSWKGTVACGALPPAFVASGIHAIRRFVGGAPELLEARSSRCYF